jgi:hypothetical protein
VQLNTPIAFDLTTPYVVAPHNVGLVFSILPRGSAIIHTGLPHYESVDFSSWEHQVKQLPTGYRFFINHSYDPVKISNNDILCLLDLIKFHHPGSDPVFLSSKCDHYFVEIPGVVYFPNFFFYNFSNQFPSVRSKRIGCLNRQNTPHRPWLMHNLLSQGLLDQRRDIYSVSFASPYDLDSYTDVDGWLQHPQKVNHLLQQYSPQIATNPDGFPNDVNTINHPAWHTAVTVVTETESGNRTMISEKTPKAIAANCCWTVYMGESGYRLLEEFGFAPRFFEQHAEGTNIDPIMRVCSTLDTESVAADYRNQFLNQIDHNAKWYGNNIELGAQHKKILQSRITSPWYSRWFPKFQQSIS